MAILAQTSDMNGEAHVERASRDHQRREGEARDEEVVGDYLGAAADHMERAQGERERSQ